MQRTINTIETRVNGLGLAESAVQPAGRQEGEGEILVQLPGVDDPARVKQILQTAAVLEMYEVKDGPFCDRRRSPREARRHFAAQHEADQRRWTERVEQGWFLVTRTPVVRGSDLRDATPSGQTGSVGNQVRSVPGCRQAVWALHRGEYRQPAGDRAG